MSVSKLQKDFHIKSLPPFPAVGPSRAETNRKIAGKRRDYSPLKWEEFYDEKCFIHVERLGYFNVYRKGNYPSFLILLLHGGGYSALTWACFTEEISKLLNCQVLAIDFRSHGDTEANDENDFSAEVLTNDIIEVFEHTFSGTEPPPVMIIGHSMGGAIAVRVAMRIPSLVGLTVIDVVEGSAMEALNGMHQFLRGRPQHFQTLEAAIEWCVKSGTVKNLRSARISMPGQLKQVASKNVSEQIELAELREEDEDSKVPSSSESNSDFQSAQPAYAWRIDLTKTAPYWEGWFQGLSQLFLGVLAPKLLLLAGVDRLDKDLMVGQMQGKFQMIVLPKVGHALHEDSPERVAEAIATFCTRNKLTTAKSDFEPVFPGC